MVCDYVTRLEQIDKRLSGWFQGCFKRLPTGDFQLFRECLSAKIGGIDPRKQTFWTQELMVWVDVSPFPNGYFKVPCSFSGGVYLK